MLYVFSSPLLIVDSILNWRWSSTAETCRHPRTNKLRYLDSCVLTDLPTLIREKYFGLGYQQLSPALVKLQWNESGWQHAWPKSWHNPSIRVEGLNKATKTPSEDSWCSRQDFKPQSPVPCSKEVVDAWFSVYCCSRCSCVCYEDIQANKR